MAETAVAARNAIVTGASSGIGEAFAHVLARDGYRPVLIAREKTELQRVAHALTKAYDVKPLIVTKDLSDTNAAEEIFGEMADRALTPDIVVNNAGFGLMGRADLLDFREQTAMIDLNIRTLTGLSIRYGKLMRQRGHGGIINITSVAGTLPGPNMATYYATKAYILSFTEALSYELKPFGVQVTAVLPGVTSTHFHRRAGMQNSRLMRFSIPMSSQAVAEIGYRAFRKRKRVVATGLANKFATLCTRIVPHAILLPVTAKLHS